MGYRKRKMKKKERGDVKQTTRSTEATRSGSYLDDNRHLGMQAVPVRGQRCANLRRPAASAQPLS